MKHFKMALFVLFVLSLSLLLVQTTAGAIDKAPAPTEPNNIRVITVYEAETHEEREEIEFTVTGYCSCSECCGKWAENRPKDKYGKPIVIGASGERLKPGVSVAVDPEVIPYGSIIVINGREYVAQDCGGAVKGYAIDIFCSTHEEAKQIGRRTYNGYIKQ